VYWALANTLAVGGSVHQDRVVDWFSRFGTRAEPEVEGQIVTWARAIKPIVADIVHEAVKTLHDAGVISIEARMCQTPEGEVFERTKITMLQIEEWENDDHFMSALAVRW
jgi:hypothetical protein